MPAATRVLIDVIFRLTPDGNLGRGPLISKKLKIERACGATSGDVRCGESRSAKNECQWQRIAISRVLRWITSSGDEGFL
jgi:hypothetical protein